MTETTSPPKTANRNRMIVIGGAFSLAVVCACCVIAAAVLILDPFGWNLLGFLFGRSDPLAASMPADTAFYMSVDLLKATPEKINRVVQPFSDALGLEETKNLDDLKEELDKNVLSSLNMTFKDDIEPWIGQFIGLGIQNIQSTTLTRADIPGFILAVETRNGGKADEFLLKFKEKSFPAGGDTISESQYQEVTIYASAPQYGQGVAFARSGNAVLLGTSAQDIRDAIDAQKGESLADSANYRDSVGQLPSGRILTMYMDTGRMMDSYLSLLDTIGASSYSSGIDQEQLDQLRQSLEGNTSGVGGTAIGVSIVDAGLQIDLAAVMETDKLTEDQKVIASKSGPAKNVIALFPQGTLFYAASKIPNEAFLAARDMLLNMGAVRQEDYDAAMQQFADEFGVNPDTELIPYLGGEMAVAVFPSTEGFLAQSANADLGGIILVETSDGKAMLGTLDRLAAHFGELGSPLDRKTAGDLTYYEVTDSRQTGGMFALGVGKQYLTIATSGQSLEDIFSGKNTLTKSDRYRQSAKALPGGISPVMYLDLEGLLGIVREGMSGGSLQSFNESMKALEPVTSIIAGTAPQRGRTTRSTLVILIKPVK